MNIVKRIMHFFIGILVLFGCVALIGYPEYGYKIVILLLDITLMIAGFRFLIYYLTMARYMVDGLSIFYEAILMIDLGLFVFSLQKSSQTVAMLYLVATMAFSGVLSLLRAVEARKLGAASWRTAFVTGALRLILSVICLFSLHSVGAMTNLYCLGLVNTAISHFVSAFRPAAIVYVDS